MVDVKDTIDDILDENSDSFSFDVSVFGSVISDGHVNEILGSECSAINEFDPENSQLVNLVVKDSILNSWCHATTVDTEFVNTSKGPKPNQAKIKYDRLVSKNYSLEDLDRLSGGSLYPRTIEKIKKLPREIEILVAVESINKSLLGKIEADTGEITKEDKKKVNEFVNYLIQENCGDIDLKAIRKHVYGSLKKIPTYGGRKTTHTYEFLKSRVSEADLNKIFHEKF